MKKEKEIYVYYEDYDYKSIAEEYLETPEKLKSYFGWIDDKFDENNELTIYKLVPHKVFKKETNYKFVE